MDSGDENNKLQTVAQIKDKKNKNKLSKEVLDKRSQNMQKALIKRKELLEEKKKIQNNVELIKNNLHQLINDSDEEDIKENKKIEVVQKVDNNNDYNELKNMILNINKKVEKMYILKKNKVKNNINNIPVQPVIIENNKKNNNPVSTNLLNEMRNKMLNQL